MDYFEEFRVIGLGNDDKGLNKSKSERISKLKKKDKYITLKEIEKINANNRIYQ